MNYQQFISAIIECVEKKTEGTAIVECQRVLKNNGKQMTGISIRRPGDSVAPVLYLAELYEHYKGGTEIELLAEQLLKVFLSCPAVPEWNQEEFLDYSRIRGRIVYKLVNAQKNEKLLKQVPHLLVLDLALIFYFMVSEGAFQNCSVLIKNDHLNLWKIPLIELYQAAHDNTPKLCPYVLQPLTALTENFVQPDDCRVLVLSNEQGVNGAAALLYPNVLKLIWERVGENYYLLPSSVHEFLIVPEEEGICAGDLIDMVMEVNATEVDLEDVLSDSVYYFDGDNITKI